MFAQESLNELTLWDWLLTLLKLVGDSPASASLVLQLQACATMSDWNPLFCAIYTIYLNIYTHIYIYIIYIHIFSYIHILGGKQNVSGHPPCPSEGGFFGYRKNEGTAHFHNLPFISSVQNVLRKKPRWQDGGALPLLVRGKTNTSLL